MRRLNDDNFAGRVIFPTFFLLISYVLFAARFSVKCLLCGRTVCSDDEVKLPVVSFKSSAGPFVNSGLIFQGGVVHPDRPGASDRKLILECVLFSPHLFPTHDHTFTYP